MPENSESNKLQAMIGRPLVDFMEKAETLGYTPTYLADGVDFTDFIDSLKEDYTTGELIIDEKAKTVEVTLILTSNIDAQNIQKALSDKLSEEIAWNAADNYGKKIYGKSFDLNYLVGKITASADDENTWFLKAECTYSDEDMTCEVKVTGTNNEPEVIYFDMY